MKFTADIKHTTAGSTKCDKSSGVVQNLLKPVQLTSWKSIQCIICIIKPRGNDRVHKIIARVLRDIPSDSANVPQVKISRFADGGNVVRH